MRFFLRPQHFLAPSFKFFAGHDSDTVPAGARKFTTSATTEQLSSHQETAAHQAQSLQCRDTSRSTRKTRNGGTLASAAVSMRKLSVLSCLTAFLQPGSLQTQNTFHQNGISSSSGSDAAGRAGGGLVRARLLPRSPPPPPMDSSPSPPPPPGRPPRSCMLSPMTLSLLRF